MLEFQREVLQIEMRRKQERLASTPSASSLLNMCKASESWGLFPAETKCEPIQPFFQAFAGQRCSTAGPSMRSDLDLEQSLLPACSCVEASVH